MKYPKHPATKADQEAAVKHLAAVIRNQAQAGSDVPGCLTPGPRQEVPNIRGIPVTKSGVE